MKGALRLSASVAALVCCTVAQGQMAMAQNASSTDQASAAEVVTVTAERRTQNLMTTPTTATVLNGQDLQNRDVMSVNDLQFIAPNLTINDLGQGIDFDIRGIGKGEHNTQTPIGVVLYRDGASTFPGYLAAEPFYDIKSVEVYRGPQGTFVGQNATGGAVFVTTNDPVIGGDYNGYLLGQYGNYNEGQLQAAVNIPVSDTLAVRVAGFGERRDSFYTIIDRDPADACPGNKYVGCKPGYDDADLRMAAGRLSVLWQPTSALSVSLKYDALYQNFGAALAVPYSNLLPLGAPVEPYGTPNNYHDSNLFHIRANDPQGRIDRMQRAILKVGYTFDSGIKLQSISDYNIGNARWRSDLDGTDLGNPGGFPYFGQTKDWQFFDNVGEKVYSQEFNLISPDNQRVTWVVGVYGQENDYEWTKPYQFYITVGPRFPGTTPTAGNFYQYGSWTFQGDTTNVNLAAFGQVETKLTDDVTISLGGRWTTTRSKNDIVVYSYGGSPYGTPAIDNNSQSSSKFTYKAAIDWKVNEGDYLYAFTATGYTGGGLNPAPAPGAPEDFGAVTDTDYEIGWKRSSWFDGHVRTQVNAFYTEYNDFQVTLPDPSAPLRTYEVNLPEPTKLYGVEAEAQGTFGSFSFTASVGLLKSKIGNFWAIDPRYNRLAALYPGACDPVVGATGGAQPYCVNVKGNPITYAPSFTYNFGAQYAFYLDNGDTITPRVSFAHVSAQWASMFDNPAVGDRLGARNLLGAQLEWNRDTWLVGLYGTNLLDKQYVASNNSGGLYAGPPRQYGIRITKLF
ncbi:MAG: TonB-dependent receptor plug domain-containing protein [Alphaproteobacteria bacterium]|nr:TonB-dependent receptor plug domain-containing protein [Alphaproteobacteria bacterium]